MDIKPIKPEDLVIKGVPVTQLLREYNVQDIRTITLSQAARGLSERLVNRTLPVTNAPEYSDKINQAASPDPELYKSALGTPVVIDLAFESVTYKDFVSGKSLRTPGIKFETILCTITQAKKIIKTEIQGRDGTVKEYIGLDDYQVNINGIIVGENRVYPKSVVLQLKAVLDAPVPIPVVSDFLNNLGVFNIVVNDYALPQVAGGQSKQDFSINAISDAPVEILYS